MSQKQDLLVLAGIVEQGDGFDWGIEKMVARLTSERGRAVPSFTISLDAVEALRDRLLPDWPSIHLSSIVTDGRSSGYAVLLGRDTEEAHGRASTTPRALLAAVLRAFAAGLGDEAGAPGPT